MNSWSQAPLIRLIFPFIAGILFAINTPLKPNEYFFIIICVLITVISCIVFIPKINRSYQKSWRFGILLNITFFLAAYQLTIDRTERLKPNHFLKFTDNAEYAFVRIKEFGKEKEKSISIIVDVLAINQSGKFISTCGKTVVYIEKNINSLKLKYGDELLLKAKFVNIPLPQTPTAFNYRDFLANKQIFKQSFLKSADWLNTGINSGYSLIRTSINIQHHLLSILVNNDFNKDELSVSAALLLGNSDKLDSDIVSAYSSSGVLHVLAVSGLHVSIIFLILNGLLFFMGKIKNGNIIKALLLLFLLWLYALITGLSPSVLRAVTMFSFIIVAKAFNRNTNIYNTLAASALLLLLISPYIIMQVGFQLSYIAVIGIVAIQPKIYQWLTISNRFLDYVWAITSVSIAAQLVTLPLTFYYFHQFPVYFLLANLLVIPLSTLALCLGIVLFIVSGNPLLLKYALILFKPIVTLLNTYVKQVEKLPHALIDNIYISQLESILLYGIIIFLFFYLNKKHTSYLLVSLSCLVVLLGSFSVNNYQSQKQKKIIIYNIPKAYAIDFINSKKTVLITDTLALYKINTFVSNLKLNWSSLGITNNSIVHSTVFNDCLWIKDNCIQFYNKRLVLINKEFKIKSNFKNSSPLKIDYLILSNNSTVSIDRLKLLFDPKLIVFDSSNSDYIINNWKQHCKKIKQPYYSVVESGTMVINL
ncbi:MAG: ComEC/Rec2 family competence protein [Bacteroidia bacterium]